MTPSQLSIVSTSPEVPTSSAISSLSVTFNRDLTNEEKSSLNDLILMMIGTSSNTSSHEQCEFENGTIGVGDAGLGTYVISNKTMMINFSTNQYVSVFELDV